MAEVFMNKIAQRVYEAPNEAGLRAIATAKAQERFDAAVQKLKDDFENSDVTKELDRGVGSPNISHTLRGADAPENLYAFIGFEAGTNPTEPIRERLDPSHDDGPRLRYRGKEQRGTAIRYQFVATTPKEDAIWEATPLPWPGFEGLSWARKIEGKIQGFASFIARYMGDPSRSGGGVQAKNPNGSVRQIRSGDYTRPDGGYLQTMFRRFLRRVKGDR